MALFLHKISTISKSNLISNMKNLSLFGAIILFLPIKMLSQGTPLPTNPKPGMCYIRCVEEDVWREKTVQVTKIPGYIKLEKVPAVFKNKDVQVIVKPASKRFEIIPAVYKTVSDTIIVLEGHESIKIIPTTLTNVIEEVLTQPGYSRFESKSAVDICKSKDPRDCEVLCYVEYPEQKTPINVQKVSAITSFNKTKIEAKKMIFKKEVLVSAPQIKEIEIPAVYKTISTRVLVSNDTVREITVEPQYENVTTRVLEKSGAISSWEEIACSLTNPNILPIYYDLNSARLTSEAKSVINEKLLTLMTEKTRIRIEISSHTDSRDSDNYNIELSQRRAQSVVDYLITKGIKPSRLVAKGYGETRLAEPCPNGAKCTEAQHAKNRRTEFRVLTN